MSDLLFEKPDPLVPDPKVAEEFGVSLMTLWRWDHDARMAELGWERPVKIRNRNYRSRSVLEKVKATAMKIGIARLKATPPLASPPRSRKQPKVGPTQAQQEAPKFSKASNVAEEPLSSDQTNDLDPTPS
jgi:hypothetical protein